MTPSAHKCYSNRESKQIGDICHKNNYIQMVKNDVLIKFMPYLKAILY